MKFTPESQPLYWMADYTVPNVQLSETKRPVIPQGKKVEFGFTVENATEEQKRAGYIDGNYTFTFDPPSENTVEFTGNLEILALSSRRYVHGQGQRS